MPKYLTMIDLFAGAGGLSEGFVRAGFKPIAHVEMDAAACNTLRTRASYHWLKGQKMLNVYEKYLSGEITRSEFYKNIPENILDSVIEAPIGAETNPSIFRKIRKLHKSKNIDLLIGGPPCQAYSLMGRSADRNRMQGDHRNYLYKYYIEFLKEFSPKYFVFENVTGLLSAKDKEGRKYLDLIKASFIEAGYQIAPLQTINASDYGVPQNRKRIIIIGKKCKNPPAYPIIKKSQTKETITELFSDLPQLRANGSESFYLKSKAKHLTNLAEMGIREEDNKIPLTYHITRPNNKRDLNIYRRAAIEWLKFRRRIRYDELPKNLRTHKNTESFNDRFKVVAGDETASHTVVAHIAKDGHYYIHPDPDQNRSISVREAARLQTFPDDYYFEGISEKPSRTAAYKQIGNAVPVLLAQRIGEALISHWSD